MKSMAQRRQAVLDAFDVQERMSVLLSALSQSPNLWEEEDAEVADLMKTLVEEGLLDSDGATYITNAAGKAILIAYIKNEYVNYEQDED